MKSLIAAITLIAFLGFAGFTHAVPTTQPTAKKTKTHRGTFLKVEKDVLTYKSSRPPNKEHTIKVDDNTKVTLDKKETKLADLKPDYYLVITDDEGIATVIAASVKPPEPKTK